MVYDFGLQDGQSFVRQQAIDWFSQHYPKIKKGTVTAHLIRLSVNAPSRLHYTPKLGEDDLFFQIDSNHFRLYDSKQDPSPIYSVANGTMLQNAEVVEEGVELGISTEFAYESDLRDYLAKNLQIIEPGLRLYEEEGITGVEFPVGGRFIDILAVDSKNDFVVIELKVSRGYDRVIGQLLRYMAWIQKNQADSEQKIRGVIIARKISEDLMLACSLMQNVKLFEYELALSLKQINPINNEIQ
ncbi:MULTISPECIES: endonuclease NucS domain-containing protein [Trichocoleus]|nr:endonuclease NucS domain-containing protein [Trichocoleus sp. FACHB-46]